MITTESTMKTDETRNIEQTLFALPFFFIEREGTGPVRVIDLEGDAIELTAYHQLTVLSKFIRKNCPHQ